MCLIARWIVAGKVSKMGLAPYQRRILDLHLELELMMADLYELFANKFKEYSELWLSLSNEEKQHAAWLIKLLEGINVDKVRFDEGKTRTYTLSSVLNYLRSVKEEFVAKPFNIVRAASLMRDFENSLLEKNIFKSFVGDSPQVKDVLAKLVDSQRTHTKKVNESVERILHKA